MLLLPLVLVRWLALAYRAVPQPLSTVVSTLGVNLLPQLPVTVVVGARVVVTMTVTVLVAVTVTVTITGTAPLTITVTANRRTSSPLQ